jgi:hypothetical protein
MEEVRQQRTALFDKPVPENKIQNYSFKTNDFQV